MQPIGKHKDLAIQMRQITDMLIVAKQESRKGNEEAMLKYLTIAEEFFTEYQEQIKAWCRKVKDKKG